MLVKIFLALLLSMQVSAYERSFDGVEWQVQSTKYDASLYWQLDSSIYLTFYKQAGLPLELRLGAPHIIQQSENASLYVISSPLTTTKNKIFLGQVDQSAGRLSDGFEVVFNQDVSRLLSAMSKGDWGLLEMKMSSGLHRMIEIPAIDFIKPLEAFNAHRNSFPLLGWKQGEHSFIRFDVDSYELGWQQKRLLKDLADLIAYDGEVKSIEVDGHTDITGHRLNNLTLSQKRAQSVRDYLIQIGVDESLFEAVRYHGQRYPISGASHQENRRVEIRLSH